MTLFPIVERELRVASRQSATYWSRFGAAAAALGLGSWILYISRRSSPSQLGSEIFATLTAVMFVYIVAVGTQITCDCISEEKRDGTLGLLFLTDLTGYDVVFGKLSATSLRVIYGIFAIIPILTIPMLMGGVGYGEFWRVVLTAVNLLFFSLSTGILASALCRSASKAVGVAALIAVTLMALPPLIVWLWQVGGNRVWGSLLIVSPAYDCFGAFERLYRRHPTDFWANALFTHVCAWLFLALACWVVPRSWKDEETKFLGPLQLTLPKFLRRGTVSSAARARLLAQNPYRWRCDPVGIQWSAIWLALIGIVVLAAIIGHVEALHRRRTIMVLIFTPIILNIIIKGWAAFQSSKNVNEDRRSGGLELLLATPLNDWEIIRGQRRAYWGRFIPVIALALLTYAILFFFFRRFDRSATTIIFYLVASTTLVADMWALSWVGPWMGLKARSSNRAANCAILRILILPAVAALILMGISEVLQMRILNKENVVFILWGLVSLIFSIIFWAIAKVNLTRNFRKIVTLQGSKE